MIRKPIVRKTAALLDQSRPAGGIGCAWCTQNSDELLCRDQTDPAIVKVLMAIYQKELAVMLCEGVPSDNDHARLFFFSLFPNYGTTTHKMFTPCATGHTNSLVFS